MTKPTLGDMCTGSHIWEYDKFMYVSQSRDCLLTVICVSLDCHMCVT